jgi:hypothetical protein
MLTNTDEEHNFRFCKISWKGLLTAPAHATFFADPHLKLKRLEAHGAFPTSLSPLHDALKVVTVPVQQCHMKEATLSA